MTLILNLLACYTTEKFQADFAETACNKYDECGYLDALQYDDVDACIEETETQAEDEDEDCDLDRAKAKECLSGWEELSCDDIQDPSKWPEACASVADCPEP